MTESARLSGRTVGLDGRGDDLAAFGELGGEPVVVYVPRETADEDRLDLVVTTGRGLDGGCLAVGELDLLGCGGLGFGLALGAVGSYGWCRLTY